MNVIYSSYLEITKELELILDIILMETETLPTFSSQQILELDKRISFALEALDEMIKTIDQDTRNLLEIREDLFISKGILKEGGGRGIELAEKIDALEKVIEEVIHQEHTSN